MAKVVPLPAPETAPEERPVLVVDLGGQYSQLIARRVREASVYSELVGHRLSAQEIAARHPAALVLSGGPASVYAEGAPEVDPAIFELGVPTLGICYGMQLMARDLGGEVAHTGVSEFGKTELETAGSELFHDLPPELFLVDQGLSLRHEGPDRFRWVLKGRIVPVHKGLSDDRGHLLRKASLLKVVQQGFLNHVSDRSLRIRATDIQGNKGKLVTGEFPSSVDETNLRPIPVRNHDAQALGDEIGNITPRFFNGFVLPRESNVVLIFYQRVSSDCQNRQP